MADRDQIGQIQLQLFDDHFIGVRQNLQQETTCRSHSTLGRDLHTESHSRRGLLGFQIIAGDVITDLTAGQINSAGIRRAKTHILDNGKLALPDSGTNSQLAVGTTGNIDMRLGHKAAHRTVCLCHHSQCRERPITVDTQGYAVFFAFQIQPEEHTGRHQSAESRCCHTPGIVAASALLTQIGGIGQPQLDTAVLTDTAQTMIANDLFVFHYIHLFQADLRPVPFIFTAYNT